MNWNYLEWAGILWKTGMSWNGLEWAGIEKKKVKIGWNKEKENWN